MDFSGLIAYPVTPFTTAGAVDLPELARQVEVLVGSGVEGAIMGKALYAGRFTLEQALDVAGRPGA